MKTFKFSLQALLTVRQRQERFALESYASALLNQHNALQSLKALDQRLSLATSHFRSQIDTGCNADACTQLHAHYSSLQQQYKLAASAFTHSQLAVQSSLQSMLESRRQREIVDTCRNRQFQRHSRHQAHLENRLLDDLASKRTSSPFSPPIPHRPDL